MYVVERSAAPTDPFANDIYLDNGTNTASGVPGWRRYTGAAWEDIGATAGGGLSTGDQIADIMAVFDPDNSSDDAAHVTKEDGGGGSNPAEQYRVISFDDSVDEYQDFLVRFYDQYSPAASGDVLTVRLPWSAETATTNNVEWVVSFRRANFDGEDMTAAFNYSTLAQSVVDTAPGTQGQITQALVSFTKAESDAIVGGELAIMRVSRDITPSSGSNMSDDAYLWPAVQVVMA